MVRFFRQFGNQLINININRIFQVYKGPNASTKAFSFFHNKFNLIINKIFMIFLSIKPKIFNLKHPVYNTLLYQQQSLIKESTKKKGKLLQVLILTLSRLKCCLNSKICLMIKKCIADNKKLVTERILKDKDE